MEQTMRPQAREVAKLHQTIKRMARILQAPAWHDEMNWHGMTEWLEECARKWDAHYQDKVV